MLYKTYLYTTLMFHTGIKIMNGKFLHDIMLVNWLYGGIRTLLFLWWIITVESVLKGTCIEDHLSIKTTKKLWISSLYPQCIHVFLWLVLSQKDILSQKDLWCKRKARPRKCKLLNDWNHWEDKKKRYTSKAD